MKVNRDNILECLLYYFNNNDKYCLIICDMGFGKVDYIKKMFPHRVFNFGIMEQATVGIASGMAKEGMIPIIYSIATFITHRALEQIKIDILQMNRNVKIIGTGCNDYFKGMGECHHCGLDDIKVLRAINFPCYSAAKFSNFDKWITSDKGGYIRV